MRNISAAEPCRSSIRPQRWMRDFFSVSNPPRPPCCWTLVALLCCSAECLEIKLLTSPCAAVSRNATRSMRCTSCKSCSPHRQIPQNGGTCLCLLSHDVESEFVLSFLARGCTDGQCFAVRGANNCIFQSRPPHSERLCTTRGLFIQFFTADTPTLLRHEALYLGCRYRNRSEVSGRTHRCMRRCCCVWCGFEPKMNMYIPCKVPLGKVSAAAVSCGVS